MRARAARARVLAALQVEPERIAKTLTYKIYLQPHLAAGLGAALEIASSMKPRPERIHARLVEAIEDWPDHPIRDKLAHLR